MTTILDEIKARHEARRGRGEHSDWGLTTDSDWDDIDYLLSLLDRPVGGDSRLISDLQREMAFYFGAHHGNGTHRRPAADCDESECVRVRKLLHATAIEAAKPRVSEDDEQAAREIVKYISYAAIELAFTRHELTTTEYEEQEHPDVEQGVEAFKELVEEVKTDALACLTGDEEGCLDAEDVDYDNEMRWLMRRLAADRAAARHAERERIRGWVADKGQEYIAVSIDDLLAAIDGKATQGGD